MNRVYLLRRPPSSPHNEGVEWALLLLAAVLVVVLSEWRR